MAETSAQDRVDSRSSQPEGLRELLRSWRREHGLTQRQAARFFRCSAGSWASWEMGVVPNPSTLRRLAVVMAVPLGELRAAAGPDRVRRPQTCGDDTTTPLAAARISRGLSQPVVADRLSISVPTLSRWEGGEFRPHPADYPRIAEVFDLPVAEVARWFDTYPTRQARSVGRLRGLAHEWRGRGHSDAAIAAALGVDRERLRQWGTGRVGVPHEVWERLCEHLDLDPAQDRLRLRVRPAPAAPTSPLARLRIARGLTQHQLGARIGVSGSAIGSWESGRRPLPVSAARLLSSVLGCSPSDLLGEDRRPSIEAVAPLATASRGTALRAHRRQLGLSAAQVSRAVGVSSDTVRRWENDESRPTEAMARRLEIVYGLRRGTLTQRDDLLVEASGRAEISA